MNPRWLFRMARWAQNPPSAKRVKFFVAILVVCLLAVAVESFIGWPEALSLDPKGTRWKP